MKDLMDLGVNLGNAAQSMFTGITSEGAFLFLVVLGFMLMPRLTALFVSMLVAVWGLAAFITEPSFLSALSTLGGIACCAGTMLYILDEDEAKAAAWERRCRRRY